MSLFVRTNGNATILTPPSTYRLKWYFAFRQNPIFLKDQSMKNINPLSMYGEKFYQLQVAQRRVK